MTIDRPVGAATVPVATEERYRYRAIPPTTEGDLAAVWGAIDALREVVEVLVGVRGDTRGRAVIIDELLADSDSPLKRPEREGISSYLRRTEHQTVKGPSYAEDPHQQYWHKALDPAWARMRASSTIGPFTAGDVIKPWAVPTSPAPYHIVADGTLGTLTNPSLFYTGVYAVFLTLPLINGISNGAYDFRLFSDGVAYGSIFPVRVGDQQTRQTSSFATLIDSRSAGVLDLRCVAASSTFNLIAGTMFLVYRISPLPGTITSSELIPSSSFTNGFTTGFWA